MNEVTTAPVPHAAPAAELPAPAGQPHESMAALFTGIINDAQRLISQQIELVKVEIRDDMRKLVSSLVIVAIGSGLLLMGGLLMCFMLVYALSTAFELQLWLSFLIVGGVLTLLGATMVYVAVQQFAHMNPLPDQSLDALKENLTWKTNPK